MTKATRIDVLEASDKLRIVLVADDRERFLNPYSRAALIEAREVIRAVILREAAGEKTNGGRVV